MYASNFHRVKRSSPARFILARGTMTRGWVTRTAPTALPEINARLQVIILLVGKGDSSSLLHLLLVLLKKVLIDLGGGGSQSRGSNEFLFVTS